MGIVDFIDEERVGLREKLTSIPYVQHIRARDIKPVTYENYEFRTYREVNNINRAVYQWLAG